MKLKNGPLMWLASLGILCLFVALWQGVSHLDLVSAVFFPAPTRSFESLWDQMRAQTSGLPFNRHSHAWPWAL